MYKLLVFLSRLAVLNFFVYQIIPCHIRARFLRKHAVATFQHATFAANLYTKEGFSFGVNVTNNHGVANFHGRMWKGLCEVYDLKAGDELYVSMDPHGPGSRVTTPTFPKTHPCNACT